MYNFSFFCHRHLYFVVHFFSFCKVMKALAYPWCWCELVFASCILLRLNTGWLENLPFSTVIAKVWTEEASCPTIFLRFETDWVCELKLALISFRSSSMVRFCCSIVEWVKFLKFWNASSYGLGWELLSVRKCIFIK